MYVINEDHQLIIIPNYGGDLEQHPLPALIQLQQMANRAVMRGKQIVILDDYFEQGDQLFYIRGTIDLTKLRQQLHDTGEPDREATDDSKEQVRGFSKEVLGLGRSGAPRGNG